MGRLICPQNFLEELHSKMFIHISYHKASLASLIAHIQLPLVSTKPGKLSPFAIPLKFLKSSNFARNRDVNSAIHRGFDFLLLLLGGYFVWYHFSLLTSISINGWREIGRDYCQVRIEMCSFRTDLSISVGYLILGKRISVHSELVYNVVSWNRVKGGVQNWVEGFL